MAGTVVISGASTGIGRATALHLEGLGFDVLAGVRREADAPEGTTPVLLDVTDQAAIDALAQRVAGRPLAGLVNNAGIGVGGPVEHIPLAEWRRQFEVNLFGHVAMTQALLPALLAGRGRIVNIGSIGGRQALPLLSPYAASKFAMHGLSDSLRLELRRQGVHVALVEPARSQRRSGARPTSPSRRSRATFRQRLRRATARSSTARARPRIARRAMRSPPTRWRPSWATR